MSLYNGNNWKQISISHWKKVTGLQQILMDSFLFSNTLRHTTAYNTVMS